MSWTTFFILVICTILTGWLVVRFWLQILIIYYIVQLILILLISSGLTTFSWYLMKGIMTGSGNVEGLLQVWTFSLIFFIVVIAVYAAILGDILAIIRKLVDKILK
jgi:hypothetical protein